MIKLTNPVRFPNSVGGVDTIPYDIFEFTQIVSVPQSLSLNGNCQLRSSTRNDAVPVPGTFNINSSAILIVDIDKQNLRRRIQLTPQQKLAVDNIINHSNDNLESGFIGLGIVVGTVE